MEVKGTRCWEIRVRSPPSGCYSKHAVNSVAPHRRFCRQAPGYTNSAWGFLQRWIQVVCGFWTVQPCLHLFAYIHYIRLPFRPVEQVTLSPTTKLGPWPFGRFGIIVVVLSSFLGEGEWSCRLPNELYSPPQPNPFHSIFPIRQIIFLWWIMKASKQLAWFGEITQTWTWSSTA